jgi:hypothetical protein
MKWLTTLLMLSVVGLGAAVVANRDDIMRYIRMRQM